MSTVVPTPRLGGPIYQPRTPPPSAAIVVTSVSQPTNRANLGITRLLSGNSATAAGKISPFWGSLKSPRRLLLSTYAGLLCITSVLLTVGVFSSYGVDASTLWVVLFLGIFAAVAERQGVAIGAHAEGSVSVLPVLLAAVVLGPSAAILVAFASFLFYVQPFTRWLVWTSTRVMVAGAAGLAAASIAADDRFLSLLEATVAAACVEGLGSAVFASITVAIRHPGTFAATFRTTGRMIAATVPLYAPTVAVLAYVFIQLTPWTLLLFAVPALAAQRLLSLYQQQALLSDDLAFANARLEGASISFAGGLVAALDARDEYTAGHSAAVAIYARDIAREMRLTDAQQSHVHLAGLLHDIGKVGLPPGILEKIGPLTAHERAVMEAHSIIGERIVRNVEGFGDLALAIRHHHERFDGAGYPDGLAEEKIPLFSRIIAVADAYNAMTSERPYRAALTTQEAQERLAQEAGAQFDPIVVAAFETLLGRAAESYLVANQAHFALDARWRAVSSTPVGVAI